MDEENLLKSPRGASSRSLSCEVGEPGAGSRRRTRWSFGGCLPRWVPRAAAALSVAGLAAFLLLFSHRGGGARRGGPAPGLGGGGAEVLLESTQTSAGIWSSFGPDSACRLSASDATADGLGSAVVAEAGSVSDCQALCERSGVCHGIEFLPSGPRCELWTLPAGHTVAAPGFQCLAFTPTDQGTGQQPDKARVWLTKASTSTAAAEKLLEPQADVSFGPNGDDLRAEEIPKAVLGGAAPVAESAAAEVGTAATLSCKLDEHGDATQDCEVVVNSTGGGEASRQASSSSGSKVAVLVDSADVLQEMAGFGAAMTHSSAQVLITLKYKDPGLYHDLLVRLFGTGEDSAGISLIRVPIGSSDFAPRETTFDDVPELDSCTGARCDPLCSLPGGACSKIVGEGAEAGKAANCDLAPGCGEGCVACAQCKDCCCAASDWMLSLFGPRINDIILALQDAKAVNPDLRIMGSPWSPPAWFKTHGTLDANHPDNTLLGDDLAYETYAEYLARVAQAFQHQGVPLSYLTLQNEPLFGWAKYPGMYLPAGGYARLGKEVQLKLLEFGLGSIKLLAYDHNWDHPEYPLEVFEEAPGVFAGTAWHCYAGSMSGAQEKVQRAHPELEQHFTECTGSFPDNTCDIAKGMEGFGWNHDWDMNNIFLGAVAHWARSGVKWIMITDESCGPFLPKVDFRWGRPLVSVPSYAVRMDDIRFHQDFWTVAHMARFVKPGARRVRSIVAGSHQAIIEAFRDDAAKTITLMAHNSARDKDLPLVLSSFGAKLEFTVPEWSTAVLVWESLATPLAPTPAPPPPQAPSFAPRFQPVDGGTGRACRGPEGEKVPDNFDSFSYVKSLQECQMRCEGAHYCTGIQYSDDERCEVWKAPIKSSVAAEATECHLFFAQKVFEEADGGTNRVCRGEAGGSRPVGRLEQHFFRKCVGVWDDSIDIDGASVKLLECGSGAVQDFDVPAGSQGQISWSEHPTKCLEVRDGSTASGTVVELRACSGSSRQKFTMPQSGTGPIRWGRRRTKCLSEGNRRRRNAGDSRRRRRRRESNLAIQSCVEASKRQTFQLPQSTEYSLHLGIETLAACKALCSKAPMDCAGIEYREDGARCEVWRRAILSTEAKSGSACLRYVPGT